ncbi:CCAAT/enhancer-binding protein zeta-like [Diadema antillarum]|uniref:CCAAT/enhancer-binding protein zeta-like n=1 Tax=Diadema antillarum TaxID=105358 RepID=UPI003A84C705
MNKRRITKIGHSSGSGPTTLFTALASRCVRAAGTVVLLLQATIGTAEWIVDTSSRNEDLLQLMNSIQDDGGEMETSHQVEGEDVPASEINDIIKKLKLDRYQQEPSSFKEKKKKKKLDKKAPSLDVRNKSIQENEDKITQEDGSRHQTEEKPDILGHNVKTKKKGKKVEGNTAVKAKVKDTQNAPKVNARTVPSVGNERSPEKNVKQHSKGKVPVNLQMSPTSIMLVPSGVKWFTILESAKSVSVQPPDEAVVTAYKEYATKLYDNEVELYAARKSSESGSQSRWMQTVAKSGALSDKVAALTLEVQGAPVHTPLSLDSLLAMVRKKGRREALLGLDAVKRLFLEELLPSNRKLKLFSQHSFEDLERKCGSDRAKRDKQILMYFFEDQLKQKYSMFLDIIEKMLQDTLSAIKGKALSACYELLVNRPEEEKRLLRLIVNKVGDPDYKVAAKAVHWLQKLVEVHSMMKFVVVQAIEELLFRPNINTKAQYYAICFLNQLVLNQEEDGLATQLIVVYLSFFKACTKQKKIDNKMLSAVITGVHRAFPYSKEDEKVHEQLDTLFKVIHKVAFNTSIQALLLVKQVLDKRKSTMDRFYSALYRKLLDPQLSTSPRHAMFLNLLFQTLKEDEVFNRVKAFVKRLLQVCSWQQPPFIAAVLVLVSEVIRVKPSLGIFSSSWNEDSDDEHFVDINEEEEEDETSDKRKRGEMKTTSHETREDKSSWVHRQTAEGDKDEMSSSYDALARNPLHSHVDNAIMWELKVLSKHFHPSVALFASQLLSGTLVSYTGNPLQDFTATRFLDRFVYRNPKQKLIGRESVMQPKSRSYKPPAVRNLPVNSKDFTSLTEENVPIDEMFFHRFFSNKDHKQKKTKEKTDSKEKTSQEREKKVEEDEDIGDSDDSIDEFVDESPDEIDSDASSIDDEEFDRILDEMEGGAEDPDLGDDFDFAGEFQKKSSKKQSKKRKAAEGEDESSSDDDDDDGEEEDDDESDADDDDMDDLPETEDIDGLDEEAFEMSDEDFPGPKASKASKRKRRREAKKPKRQRESTELSDVTEKISSMIDENVGSKFDVGLNALANKDKADMKQLRWEMDRDRWVRGVDSRSKIRAKKLSRGPRAKGFRGKGRGKQKR